jgi:succinate dehydrogenase / fumarate reductase iron-sulfur subunit
VTDSIKARVFRYDPEQHAEPYYDEYLVESVGPTSVLALLDRIQKGEDPTLSFRTYCCGLNMCRSCLMKINAKKRYACLTLVGPGDEVVIEPLSFPELHVKDLVVKVKQS